MTEYISTLVRRYIAFPHFYVSTFQTGNVTLCDLATPCPIAQLVLAPLELS